jgi:hypothetical protein
MKKRSKGFTLTELLVAVGFLALLALLFLPAYGDSRTKSRGVRCLGNLRQVMNGALMYTHDYHDLFPPNPDDGTTTSGYAWAPGQVFGGMPDDPPPAAAHTFDTGIITNFLLFKYVGRDPTVFRCTADPRQGLYDGSDFSKFGTIVPAVRGISMSGAVGTIDPGFASGGGHSGIPNLPVPGVWLTGNHGMNRHNSPWRTYGSLTDMVIPIPANIMVFIEEDPYSINDGFFAFSAGQVKWVDWPTTRHNMAGALTFADGHAELHKWQNIGVRIPNGVQFGSGPSGPNDPDWLWLKARVSVLAQ